MSRQSRPLRLIEAFAPDPARCAAALIRLLDGEPQDTAPDTPTPSAEAPLEPEAAPETER